MVQNGHSCGGPGYSSPQEALKAPKEKLIYTVALIPQKDREDYVLTIDADSDSKTYSQVIDRLPLPYIGDELHHFGWNSCSSCHGQSDKKRTHLIIPGFFSSRIYIVNVAKDPRHPSIEKIIEPEDLKELNVGKFHTVHCQGNGEIIISSLGTLDGKGHGNYLILDQNFNIKGKWTPEDTKLGYDFWYQPRHNVMLSSEFGKPEAYEKGFDPSRLKEDWGDTIYVWDYEKRKPLKKFQLGGDSVIPLEIRYKHDPNETHAFVGCAFSSNIIHIYLDDKGEWQSEVVIKQDFTEVEGWALPQVPPLITDILISMDDRFLYFSNWLRGDISQYDITDPHHPKLVGRLWAGGVIAREKGIKVKSGLPDGLQQPEPSPTIKGTQVRGGPQMLQLSLDGKRLYWTDSLVSSFDKQFYPDMVQKGSCMLQADVNTEKGGLKLNQDFFIDFNKEPKGPPLVHELRFSTGDCSSDIFV